MTSIMNISQMVALILIFIQADVSSAFWQEDDFNLKSPNLPGFNSRQSGDFLQQSMHLEVEEIFQSYQKFFESSRYLENLLDEDGKKEDLKDQASTDTINKVTSELNEMISSLKRKIKRIRGSKTALRDECPEIEDSLTNFDVQLNTPDVPEDGYTVYAEVVFEPEGEECLTVKNLEYTVPYQYCGRTTPELTTPISSTTPNITTPPSPISSTITEITASPLPISSTSETPTTSETNKTTEICITAPPAIAEQITELNKNISDLEGKITDVTEAISKCFNNKEKLEELKLYASDLGQLLEELQNTIDTLETLQEEWNEGNRLRMIINTNSFMQVAKRMQKYRADCPDKKHDNQKSLYSSLMLVKNTMDKIASNPVESRDVRILPCEAKIIVSAYQKLSKRGMLREDTSQIISILTDLKYHNLRSIVHKSLEENENLFSDLNLQLSQLMEEKTLVEAKLDELQTNQ